MFCTWTFPGTKPSLHAAFEKPTPTLAEDEAAAPPPFTETKFFSATKQKEKHVSRLFPSKNRLLVLTGSGTETDFAVAQLSDRRFLSAVFIFQLMGEQIFGRFLVDRFTGRADNRFQFDNFSVQIEQFFFVDVVYFLKNKNKTWAFF